MKQNKLRIVSCKIGLLTLQSAIIPYYVVVWLLDQNANKRVHSLEIQITYSSTTNTNHHVLPAITQLASHCLCLMEPITHRFEQLLFSNQFLSCGMNHRLLNKALFRRGR